MRQRIDRLRDAPLVDYAGVAAVKQRCSSFCTRIFATHHLTAETARCASFRAFQAHAGEGLRAQALFDALQRAPRARCTAGRRLAGRVSRPRLSSRRGIRRARTSHASSSSSICSGRPTCSSPRRGAARDAGWRSACIATSPSASTPAAPKPGRKPGAVSRRRAASARRPTSSTQSGQDWGLPPLDPAAAGAPRLRAVDRDAARQHAPRRRAAHRSRHGARAPVLDPAGSGAARRRVRALSVRRPCWACSRWKASATRCIVDRRGPRHGARRACARRWPSAAMLSYRVLYFEQRRQRRFQARRRAYPADALVDGQPRTTSPTLRRLLAGADLACARRARAFPGCRRCASGSTSCARAIGSSSRARAARWTSRSCCRRRPRPIRRCDWCPAAHAFLARTPSRLMIVQLEDVFGVPEQVNLPGTDRRAHPNWRRKLPLDAGGLGRRRRALPRMQRHRVERGRELRAPPRADARRRRDVTRFRAPPIALQLHTRIRPSRGAPRSCPTSRRSASATSTPRPF